MVTDEDYARLERAKRVATAMDDGVRIPLTPIRIGLDPVIGLAPVVGDLATALVSLYVIAEAAAAGVSGRRIARMIVNVLIDTLVGFVPILGDAFDALFHANRANVKLFEQDLERRAAAPVQE